MVFWKIKNILKILEKLENNYQKYSHLTLAKSQLRGLIAILLAEIF